MAVNTFPITLKETLTLSPNVKHFTFSCNCSPAFTYLPGQFITIHFEHQNKNLNRSYSIANIPTQNNLIEIAAGYVENGPGSDLLFNLKPGDSLQASGPYGRLTLKDEPYPLRYILIATSTGITPYRSMIAELTRRMENNPNLHIIILQGIQKRCDILYPDEWAALTKKYSQATFYACLSREDKSELNTNEYAGHVQTVFPDLQLNPENDHVYLCGNPAMIDDAFLLLKEKGFPIQHIIREKYISR